MRYTCCKKYAAYTRTQMHNYTNSDISHLSLFTKLMPLSFLSSYRFSTSTLCLYVLDNKYSCVNPSRNLLLSTCLRLFILISRILRVFF